MGDLGSEARGKGRSSGGRHRRVDIFLFAFVLVLAGYFYNGWGWNQTARYDAIWAFVEPGPHQGTVRIDDFLIDAENGINTGDWARNAEHSPHYYANKAPGTTLLGIPFYGALYGVESMVGVDPLEPAVVLVNAYLIHLWVTVLPLALSALFFRRILQYAGARPRRAAALTLLTYSGTLLLPFSTAMWGHTTAAAFVVMALGCFLAQRKGAWLAAGLLAGLAVLTDYGAGPFAASLVGLAVLRPVMRPRVPWVVAGGAGPLVVFVAYHWVLFGSPFTLASSYSASEMITERYVLGLFGIPHLEAFWSLTFSSARGLFVFMPVLLMAMVGVFHIRGHRRAELGWLVVFNVAAALLMNMSFNAWQGGVSAGPRYLITALPLFGLLLAFVPDDRRVRTAIIGLGGLSVANMFVIAAVSPMAPDAFRGSPLLFSWAKVLGVLRVDLGLEAPPPSGGPLSRGSLHVYPTIPLRDWGIPVTSALYERWASFDLGERLLGLRGVWSLVPVAGAALALGVGAVHLSEDGPDGNLDGEDVAS
ncbi:MAG: hypothetical protein HKO77_05080 [Gemmatimonadetes bacterium]|nr:hypothetical protein [Gemmatimonadota bacterium]